MTWPEFESIVKDNCTHYALFFFFLIPNVINSSKLQLWWLRKRICLWTDPLGLALPVPYQVSFLFFFLIRGLNWIIQCEIPIKKFSQLAFGNYSKPARADTDWFWKWGSILRCTTESPVLHKTLHLPSPYVRPYYIATHH